MAYPGGDQPAYAQVHRTTYAGGERPGQLQVDTNNTHLYSSGAVSPRDARGVALTSISLGPSHGCETELISCTGETLLHDSTLNREQRFSQQRAALQSDSDSVFLSSTLTANHLKAPSSVHNDTLRSSRSGASRDQRYSNYLVADRSFSTRSAAGVSRKSASGVSRKSASHSGVLVRRGGYWSPLRSKWCGGLIALLVILMIALIVGLAVYFST